MHCTYTAFTKLYSCVCACMCEWVSECARMSFILILALDFASMTFCCIYFTGNYSHSLYIFFLCTTIIPRLTSMQGKPREYGVALNPHHLIFSIVCKYVHYILACHPFVQAMLSLISRLNFWIYSCITVSSSFTVYRLLYIFIMYPRVIQLQLNFTNNEMNYGSSGVHSRHSQCTTTDLKPGDQQLVDK